jgi:hypothetical protein
LYPALVLLYAAGLSAVAAENYANLAALLGTRLRWERREREAEAALILADASITRHDVWRHLSGREREFTPLSNYLWEVLREPLRACLPDDADYEETFDWFEYLLALAHCDLRMKANPKDVWGPVGRFGWRVAHGLSRIVDDTQLEGRPTPPRVCSAIAAGLFTGPRETRRFVEVKTEYDKFLAEATRGWW